MLEGTLSNVGRCVSLVKVTPCALFICTGDAHMTCCSRVEVVIKRRGGRLNFWCLEDNCAFRSPWIVNPGFLC